MIPLSRIHAVEPEGTESTEASNGLRTLDGGPAKGSPKGECMGSLILLGKLKPSLCFLRALLFLTESLRIGQLY